LRGPSPTPLLKVAFDDLLHFISFLLQDSLAVSHCFDTFFRAEPALESHLELKQSLIFRHVQLEKENILRLQHVEARVNLFLLKLALTQTLAGFYLAQT